MSDWSPARPATWCSCRRAAGTVPPGQMARWTRDCPSTTVPTCCTTSPKTRTGINKFQGVLKMRNSAKAALPVALMILAAPALAQQAGDAWYAWSPKPDKLPPYGKNKPVTRLPAVLAKHKGEKSWSEQVLLTPRYDARWIQAAPGDKT